MTDPRHARILANIAAQVVQQYTLTRGGTTTDPEKGNVPVPEPRVRVIPDDVLDDIAKAIPHSSWNYTLPEEYQA